MKNPSQHSQETVERMKANSEAAKRRLARLNDEYRTRQQALKFSRSKAAPKRETFGEAVVRIAREEEIAIDAKASGLLRALIVGFSSSWRQLRPTAKHS